MIQKIAWGFGSALIVLGLLGFVPGVTNTDSLLLGLFRVDALHNIVHILTGLLAILAGFGETTYGRIYFQVAGVVYTLIAIVGFAQGTTILGLFPINAADSVLHLVIALFSTWVGFLTKELPYSRAPYEY